MKCLVLIFVAAFNITTAQQIKISAGSFPLTTPIEVSLEKPLPSGRHYVLKDASGKRIPAQLKDSVTLLFIPPGAIKAGSTNIFQLEEVSGAVRKSKISLEKKQNGYLVKVSGKPIFFYHVTTAMPPADSPAYYQRSGFIHPLYSPRGQILTDDFPAGHVHQHAIFSAWTNTRFRNTAVDFWNQHNRTGTVAHQRVVRVLEGPVFSEIVTELAYISAMHGVVLTEQWRLLIYPYSDHFLFDLESTQHNITNDTVFLNPYHYGGMAFRGSKEWNPDDRKHFTGNWSILTSEGKKDSSANQTAARWVDASGKVNGNAAGVTVFNHKSNFRYPQKIRVHPQMPYWCYAPMIDGAFYIAPGQRYQSRFRYYVHNNVVTAAHLNHLQEQWTRNEATTTVKID